MDADQRTGQIIERLAQALHVTTTGQAERTAAFLERRPAAVNYLDRRSSNATTITFSSPVANP